MRSVRITLFLLTFAISPVVVAAPCAGFTDVDDTSAFCANVEWVKNRAITLGCTSATSYCPSDPVTRLQMAAFMNRLGTALEPRFRYRAQSNLANNVNAGLVVCQTSPFTVTGYPRVATAQAAFSFRGTEPILLETGVEASVDEGASWQPIGAITATSNAGNHWLSMSPAASRRSTTPAPS